MRTSPRHSHEPFLPPPTSFILLFSSPLHSKDLFPLPPRIPLFSLPASARFDPGHIRFVLPPISMALCGVPLSGELLLRSGETRLFSALSHSLPTGSRKCGFSRARCFAGEKATAGASSSGLARGSLVGRELVASEEEGLDGPGPVMKFDASDFELCDRVSVGLAGRADEVIFEAVVNQPESPLFNKRVVLRRLTTLQAQRRGRRALEVLKRLARRQLMYHSYAMRVHGYFSVRDSDGLETFTLVHRYHGSYSLRHWLQLSDWLPTLEATLALDEEWVRRVGDDRVGGSAVTRQLRLTRILMRDLLIGVNYLHSHGLAHTELRLENVHICPVDKHVKVGILGNAADFYNNGLVCTKDACADRRQLMIAYDMRCVGFMMAKMVFRELMDAEVFGMFKSFLNKGGDPSCLREFLLPMLSRNSPSGSPGLQMMDRNWGAGWNLLSLLLATKPPERISCLDALRHPFLCGPRWRVDMSMDVIRWGLGSTVVRIAEEYIYGMQQRSRMAHFIELMEMLNPHTNEKEWQDLILGRWRLLYSTGRHIGLTLRQGNPSIIIGNSFLTFTQTSIASELPYLSLSSNVTFKVIPSSRWPHDKSGTPASLHITSPCVKLSPGRRIYLKEETHDAAAKADSSPEHQHRDRTLWGRIRHQVVGSKEPPFNLPVVNLSLTDFDIALDLGSTDMKLAEQILRETRLQIPPEMFDVSKLVCGTYIDSRLMIIRGVNGSALLFTRS